MYCKRCGKENPEDARFCAKCGEPLTEQKKQPDAGQKQPKRKRVLLVGIIAVVVCATGIAGVFAFKKQQTKKQYAEAVLSGEKYLEELDYKNAEDAYLKAIKIDPKEKEPYLQLAEIYLACDKVEKAQKIIKLAQKNVSAEEKKEFAEKEKKWSGLEAYEWVTDPTIEMDDIYYLRDNRWLKYTQNEMNRQKNSRYAVARKNGYYGLIDLDGKVIGDINYTGVGIGLSKKVEGNYLLNKPDGEVILVDEKSGAVQVFDDVDDSDINNGVLYYYANQAFNMCEVYNREKADKMPETAFPIRKSDTKFDEWERYYDFLSGLSDKCAIWNKDGLVSDFVYDECGSYSSGLMAVKENGKWGYVNDRGEIVIPLEYDASWEEYEMGFGLSILDEQKAYCYAATEGYVPLVKDGVWEMRNTKGDLVIAPGIFEALRPVYDGKCWAKKNGKWGVITLPNARKEEMETAEDSMEDTREEDTASAEPVSENVDYLNLYGPLLDQVYQEYGEYATYCVYDIDKNGVKELLLKTGTCEADYMFQIYTIENGKSVYLDEISGFHTAFYADENGGTENYIIQVQGHMAVEYIYYVKLEGGKVTAEEISRRELSGENDMYYSNAYPIKEMFVSDKSLLN